MSLTQALETELWRWQLEALRLHATADRYRRGGHPLLADGMEDQAKELEHRIGRIRAVTGVRLERART